MSKVQGVDAYKPTSFSLRFFDDTELRFTVSYAGNIQAANLTLRIQSFQYDVRGIVYTGTHMTRSISFMLYTKPGSPSVCDQVMRVAGLWVNDFINTQPHRFNTDYMS